MQHTEIMTDTIITEIYEESYEASPARLAFTRKAFQMLPRMEYPRILDVGCGRGGPTLELARVSGGEVIGLDIDRSALDMLSLRIEEAGLSDRVHPVHGSMVDMDFSEEGFDVIWAEGSLHAIGFEQGLEKLRRYLKQRGFFVVHEMIWVRTDPPEELCQYWNKIHSGIRTESEYIKEIADHRYGLTGHFPLPDDFWWTDYYEPLEKRVAELRRKYSLDRKKLEVLERAQREIDLYKKYPGWFGSAFFVMEKR